MSVVSRTFAEVAARFESEYIFCWLAWDGDNILTNGGIIDYGSVRQFGLFHHEYRFDDVERWSTTLTEQKDQARYIVQTFAQIEHYLNTGKKNSVQSFKNHDELKRFDRIFNATRRRLMLEKTGFTRSEAQSLLESHPDLVTQYEKAFRWFEQCTKQTKKPYRVADGVTRDALYSMRDILRELPKHLLKNKAMMTNRAFMDTIASSYCTQKDARPNLQRNLWISRFQTAWSNLVTASSQQSQIDRTHLVEQMAQRSTIINRYSRVTGDAICFVGDKILRGRKHLTGKETQELIANFIEDQVLVPERRTLPVENSIRVRGKSERLMRDMLKTVKSLRDGL